MEKKQHTKQVNELVAPHQQGDIQDYNHIELSSEEIEEITSAALREARKRRHFQIQNKKYLEKLSKPPEYPKFDAETTQKFFLKTVQNINPNFMINEHNEKIINLLSLYFSGDDRFEQDGFSLQKGIMLVGPVGCGKTTIMKAFQINSNNPYAVTTARKISDSYLSRENGGEYVINRYSNLIAAHPQQNFGFSQIGLCIDDLGVETVKKNFGNEVDVVGDIIMNRYEHELFNTTHFTANIGGNEIEQAYGPRIKSRLRQMCNFIAFDHNAPDFRK
ncbi:EutP/PduV family microcompartment system protein [Sphingobacterium siyangense]|uniref:EutP/PduV family microcompartment system protein n=1 Tax=Sphingobacterium siyangense TaxID=459529 RepID=UPI003DA6439A